MKVPLMHAVLVVPIKEVLTRTLVNLILLLSACNLQLFWDTLLEKSII